MPKGLLLQVFRLSMVCVVLCSSGTFAGWLYPGSLNEHWSYSETDYGKPPYRYSLVIRVQIELGERGYEPGPVDGIWGERTKGALMTFQRDNALTVNGHIDKDTAHYLLSGLENVPKNLARNMQKLLAHKGYNPGVADGIWDKRSRRALREFQKDRSLPPTGRLDETTIYELEIGSTH